MEEERGETVWDDEDDESLGRLALAGPSLLRSLVDDFLLWEGRPLFDLRTKSLSPLCRIEATHSYVRVTFDLPYVEKKDIVLTSTETSLEIEAKMRKPVTVRLGGPVQKRVLFHRYTTRIMLPASVVPEKAEATFKNGLLRVRIPIAKKGNKVKIA